MMMMMRSPPPPTYAQPHTHTHALSPEGDSGGSWRVGDGQERKQENRKVQEGRIENETGSQSMHY